MLENNLEKIMASHGKVEEMAPKIQWMLEAKPENLEKLLTEVERRAGMKEA